MSVVTDCEVGNVSRPDSAGHPVQNCRVALSLARSVQTGAGSRPCAFLWGTTGADYANIDAIAVADLR